MFVVGTSASHGVKVSHVQISLEHLGPLGLSFGRFDQIGIQVLKDVAELRPGLVVFLRVQAVQFKDLGREGLVNVEVLDVGVRKL